MASDPYKPDTEPPISLETAKERGLQPLLGSRAETVADKRKTLRLTRLAKEYVVDFDLVKACARADLDWNQVKHAERDPFFIGYVQELVDTIDPDSVASRQEILMGLKKEATTAGKPSDRIKAWTELARLMGMELKEDSGPAVPVINVTLNGVKTE